MELSMVENILKTISHLKGVHYACLYRDGEDVLSTFPKEYQEIENLAHKVEQIFSALQAIEKEHDELYFSVEEKLVAGYLMYDSYIAILLTDKKINFPLIRMGIRSASSKIQRQLVLNSNVTATVVDQPRATNEQAGSDTKVESPSLDLSFDAELQPVMSQITAELVNYFGPAAKFVFEDALIQWETKYVKSLNNIPELGEILVKELDSPKEKSAFSEFVEQLLQ